MKKIPFDNKNIKKSLYQQSIKSKNIMQFQIRQFQKNNDNYYNKSLSKSYIIVILLMFAMNLHAQKKYQQGFRLGFGLNTGYVLNKPFGFGLGADARLQYDLSKRYSLALTTGFTNFFVAGNNNDLGFIPVKLGFKAFIWNDQFYVLGEGGAAIAVTNSYSKNSVIIAPGIGFATKFIDLSIRYENYPNFPVLNSDDTFGEGNGQLTLRIAYGFKI